MVHCPGVRVDRREHKMNGARREKIVQALYALEKELELKGVQVAVMLSWSALINGVLEDDAAEQDRKRDDTASATYPSRASRRPVDQRTAE